MANGATGPVWTEEAIICAIQRWVIEYGDVPLSKSWHSGRRPSGYPSTATVREKFGTWNKAIELAGFSSRPRGCLGHVDPEYTIERFTSSAIRRNRARRSG